MSTSPDPYSILSDIDAFACLSEGTRSRLAEAMTTRQYAAGEALCRPNEACHKLYVIAEGQVALVEEEDGDTKVSDDLFRAGDAAGLSSLLDNEPHEYGLQARSEVTAYLLDQASFRRLLAEVPDDQWRLMRYLAKQLRLETGAMRQVRAPMAQKRLRLAFFDTKPYTEEVFRAVTPGTFDMRFFEARLSPDTAALASGCQVVVPFVNDTLSKPVIKLLKENGVGLIAMRCAGYNNVDLEAAKRAGISVTRVPAYSPHAVAEHALALILTLNRKTHRAYNRVRENNFSLNGLVGFDLHGRTAGIVGVGRIGRALAEILAGFGMTILGYDTHQDETFAERVGMRYVELDELFAEADIISLHAPLLESTYHMIDADAIASMKRGVMLVNTSRGALIDTRALIDGLKSGQVGFAGLDVYEEEEAYFFEDRSGDVITDDVLARLMTFPNALVTSHQAFLTSDALRNIATTTFDNIDEFHQGKRLEELTNAVLPPADQ